MPTLEVEEFAKLLVQQVRDAAVRDCDLGLNNHCQDPLAIRWKAVMPDKTHLVAISTVIPDCIDSAVFFLLRSIDEGGLPISFTASTGKTVNLSKDGNGEMAGWYMGSGGWRAMYSKERFVDDFSDLV